MSGSEAYQVVDPDFFNRSSKHVEGWFHTRVYDEMEHRNKYDYWTPNQHPTAVEFDFFQFPMDSSGCRWRQIDEHEWGLKDFDLTVPFHDWDSEGEARTSYPRPQHEIVTPPWGDTFSPISPAHYPDGRFEELIEGLRVPVNPDRRFSNPPEIKSKTHLAYRMRGGERKDPFIIADQMGRALHEQNKCGTEVVGALYCGCATVGLTNRCGQHFCPECHNHKAQSHRKEWRKRLKHDRGQRYEFWTMTMPQLYYWWDVEEGVEAIRAAWRDLTRSHYWRNHNRLWFGVIEPKPGLAMTEYGLIPTFHVHIHFVRSGKRMEYSDVIQKWADRGGGRVHSSGPLGLSVRGKRNARKRRVGQIISYMSKYMTGSMSDDPEQAKKWGMTDLPKAIGAYVSTKLKGRQMYFSGGRAWIEAGKRAHAEDEYACCTNCGSGIYHEIDVECAMTFIDRLPKPERGWWTTTTEPPPPPDPWKNDPEIQLHIQTIMGGGC